MGKSMPARAVGLMSGTSADGIDGVLLALKSHGEMAVEATLRVPYPAEVRRHIEALVAPESLAGAGALDLDSLGRLHTQLGGLYADAAGQLAAKDKTHSVAVIGCPGQTIRHRPGGEFPFTLQLGNAAVVARRTGIPVVGDFRSTDIAAGGQGAPLAPAFHHAVFADATEHRAVINLGGIANITHLPVSTVNTGGATVTGFDTGPANTLLDTWCQRHFDAPFDKDGARAARGRVLPQLLTQLLADPYFARPPPKSTGREYFNQTWLTRAIDATGVDASNADVLATLTALTAESVAAQVNRLTPAVDAAYLCGGGARNRTLRTMLAERCHARVGDTDELGIAAEWVEAAAFAWLAYKTLHRMPGTLPSVTGAAQPTIAGAVYFPE